MKDNARSLACFLLFFTPDEYFHTLNDWASSVSGCLQIGGGYPRTSRAHFVIRLLQACVLHISKQWLPAVSVRGSSRCPIAINTILIIPWIAWKRVRKVQDLFPYGKMGACETLFRCVCYTTSFFLPFYSWWKVSSSDWYKKIRQRKPPGGSSPVVCIV